MSTEKDWKRLVFRWTAPKGATAMVLFFVLAVFIEYLAVWLFRSEGLADAQTFQLHLAIFTVTVSPLFHIIPLGVIIVLIFSWTYLTKYIAKVPRRRTPVKKPSAKLRKPITRAKKKRFKSIRSFSRKVSWNLRKISKALKARFHRRKTAGPRIPEATPLMQRLFFARAAIRSTATVALIFLASFLAANLIIYPSLIHDSVISLYRGNPSFHGFVIGTIETAKSIGQALSPIGGLTSAVGDALVSASSGFRSAFEGFSIYVTEPLIELDLMWRYVISQNMAAWVSAIVALAYGQYASRLYRFFSRR